MIITPSYDMGFMQFAWKVIMEATLKQIRFIGVLVVISSLFVTSAYSATRYIRTDGGTGSQCTGLADAGYDGGAHGTACALNHPNWVFPPRLESTTRAAVAGDTVVIESGSYRIGCQNASTCRDSTVNLTNSSKCAPAFPYDCLLSDGSSGIVGVPSNVTVIGCTTTGCTTLAQRPELWGAGRVNQVLNAAFHTGITFKDLVITDHASCGLNHPTLGCGAADSSELSARDGILMTSSTNLTLTNVTIRGVMRDGLRGGSVSGLLVNGSSNIDFNGLSGVNFDTCNNDGTCPVLSGNTITFGDATNNPNKLVSISWNGCVEDWTNPNNPMALGCYNDASAGYGDGIGSSTTSGTWAFNYVKMVHNTSDGLDLKYLKNTGGSVSIQNSHFEGNVGNQVKYGRDAVLYNNIIIGDCDFFSGKSYTYTSFSHCRAGADAVAVNFQSGTTTKFYGNTVTNVRGNDAFTLGVNGVASCTGSNTVDVQNSIFSSASSAHGFVNKDSTCTNSVITEVNSNIYNFSTNPSGSGNVFTNPNLSGTINGSTVAVLLSSTSPGRDSANETASGQPSTDFNAYSRGASYDMGAFEFGSSYGGGGGAVCGNNSVEAGEDCDDGNNTSGDGCSATCIVESGWSCSGNPSVCTSLCGNGAINAPEECDDSGTSNGDGCSSTCTIENGYTCTGAPSVCTALCGNGVITPPEECDDNNTANSDGCSALCETEVPTYEKFLLYTETDPNSTISVRTHKATAAGLTRTASAIVRKDFGASFFGNFTHKFKVTIDSCNDNGLGADATMGIWSLTVGARGDLFAQETAADGIYVALQCFSSASLYTWVLYSPENDAFDSFTDVAPTIVRYFDVTRSGTTTTAKVYTDPNYTTLLHTMTITSPSTAYRYYYPVSAYNDGTTNTTFSGSIESSVLATGAATGNSTGLSGCGIVGGGVH